MKFSRVFVWFVFALSITSGISRADNTKPQPEIGIILLGDQGKNNEGQALVAAAMTRFCAVETCDAVILLGDNFYPSGVKSLRDKKFTTHFENHYGNLKVPFWASLGNHDYGYGWSRGNIQAQIDYGTRSTQWRMPSRYYSFTIGRTEFIAIDTVALPKDTQQLEWLREGLNAEKTGHRIVFGHYPIHSGGMHGDNKVLKEHVAPLLCGKADIYAAGHDHHLEHATTDCGVIQIVSGAGAETRPVTPTTRTKFASASLGFAYLRLKTNSAGAIEYFNEKLEKLAQFPLPLP